MTHDFKPIEDGQRHDQVKPNAPTRTEDWVRCADLVRALTIPGLYSEALT